MRVYELEVVPFDEGETEIIEVYAENRGRAFTAAALHASDPANVCSLTLLRDGGREVARDFALAPRENQTLVPPHGEVNLYRNECRLCRAYSVEMSLFSDPGDLRRESIGAPRRPDAFTAALMASGAPDDVRTARLMAVAYDSTGEAGYWHFERGRPFGGTAIDLEH